MPQFYNYILAALTTRNIQSQNFIAGSDDILLWNAQRFHGRHRQVKNEHDSL
jgi:hypothetical protein